MNINEIFKTILNEDESLTPQEREAKIRKQNKSIYDIMRRHEKKKEHIKAEIEEANKIKDLDQRKEKIAQIRKKYRIQ